MHNIQPQRPTKLQKQRWIARALCTLCLVPLPLWAQPAPSHSAQTATQVGMAPIFVSAGYGALFGAAAGAALLPFLSGSPLKNMRVVAAGASLGFLGGSLYGFYSTSHTDRSAYFEEPLNDINGEGEYYYAMPPTLPQQGHHTGSSLQVGALWMGEDASLGIPVVWVDSDKTVLMQVLALNF